MNRKELFKEVKVTDYITSLTAVIGVVFGIWLISQNTEAIRTSQRAFLSTLPQSLEITIPKDNDDNFYVKNINQNAITNVEAYFVRVCGS